MTALAARRFTIALLATLAIACPPLAHAQSLALRGPIGSRITPSLPRVRPPIARDTVPTWTELAPPARSGACAVFDEKHRRMIEFGGMIDGQTPSNAVWVLDLEPGPRWTRVEPEGTPPSGRAYAASVYDRTHERLVVIGGWDTVRPNMEVWALSLSGRMRWSQMHPAGVAPVARCRHSATLDPEHDRVIVYGGAKDPEYGFETKDDVWQFSLGDSTVWARLKPTGPSPGARDAHLAVYVPGARGIAFYGGAREVPSGYSIEDRFDTWFLATGDSLAWTDLTSRLHGTPPPGSEGAVGAYDPTSREVFTTLGIADWSWCRRGEACPPPGDPRSLWSLSLRDSSWSHVELAGDLPVPRQGSVGVLDARRHELLVHGGELFGAFDGICASDAWRLRLGSAPEWSRVEPDSVQPELESPFQAREAVYDERTRRAVVYTGAGVWSRSLEDGSIWAPEHPAGAAPPTRINHLALSDPVGRRMLVYGGIDSLSTERPRTDLWALSLGGRWAWTRIAPAGAGPAVDGPYGVYDSIRSRWVMGGASYEFNGSGLWQLGASGDRWTAVPFEVRSDRADPSEFYAAVGAFDPLRQQLLVFGGGYPSMDFFPSNMVWAFDLADTSEWQPLTPRATYNATLPYPRANAATFVDAVEDRLWMLGGNEYPPEARGLGFPDLWSLDLATHQWSQATPGGDPAPGWTFPIVAWDERARSATVFEGGAAWRLALPPVRARGRGHGRGGAEPDVAAKAAAPLAPRLALAGALPNPAGGAFTCAFTLPSRAPGALELVDVAGRRVWSQDLGAFEAGAHVVPVAGSERLPAGVYFLRLAHGGAALTAKVVRLR